MLKNMEQKQMAVAFAHLLEAGVSNTLRLSMLAYVAAKPGVTAQHLSEVFKISRPTAYSGMDAMRKKRLVRCEVTLVGQGLQKKHTGNWFVEPYGKDTVANFISAMQLKK